MKVIILFFVAFILAACNTPPNKLEEENRRLREELEHCTDSDNWRSRAVEKYVSETFNLDDKRDLMSTLFDTKDFDIDGRAVWTPNFAERMNVPISDDGFCYTQFDTVMYIKGHIHSAIVVFGTYEMHNGKYASGLTADPMLSIAVLTQDDDSKIWYLSSFKKMFMYHGAWGARGNITIQKLGNTDYALLLSGTFMNTGEEACWAGLFSLDDFRKLFFTQTCASFDGGGKKEEAYAYETRLYFSPSSEKYYLIDAVCKGTKANEDNTAIVSANDEKEYRYDDEAGVYVQQRKEPEILLPDETLGIDSIK